MSGAFNKRDSASSPASPSSSSSSINGAPLRNLTQDDLKKLDEARKAINTMISNLQPAFRTNYKEALDKFDKFFFKLKPPLMPADIVTIYNGTGKQTGLLNTCGLASWKPPSFKMKACSTKALNLLVRLLDPAENPEADEMVRIFLTLDKAQYKLMKLDSHISSSTGNKPAAQKIMALLKDRRASAFEDKKGTLTRGLSRRDSDRKINTDEIKSPSNGATSPTTSGEQPKAVSGGGFKAKLTAFLKSRPTKDTLEKKGVLKQARVFGHSIATLVKNGYTTDNVPNIVRNCCDYFRGSREACALRGIFRESGDALEIQHLQKQYDYGDDVKLEKVSSPHVVAGLLKLYFRSMSEPLLTYERYELFVANFRGEKFDTVKKMLTELPIPDQATFAYLLDFLAFLQTYRDESLMQSQNLAIVFAPNLLKMKNETYQTVAKDTPVCIGLIKFFLDERIRALVGAGTIPDKQPLLPGTRLPISVATGAALSPYAAGSSQAELKTPPTPITPAHGMGSGQYPARSPALSPIVSSRDLDPNVASPPSSPNGAVKRVTSFPVSPASTGMPPAIPDRSHSAIVVPATNTNPARQGRSVEPRAGSDNFTRPPLERALSPDRGDREVEASDMMVVAPASEPPPAVTIAPKTDSTPSTPSSPVQSLATAPSGSPRDKRGSISKPALPSSDGKAATIRRGSIVGGTVAGGAIAAAASSSSGSTVTSPLVSPRRASQQTTWEWEDRERQEEERKKKAEEDERLRRQKEEEDARARASSLANGGETRSVTGSVSTDGASSARKSTAANYGPLDEAWREFTDQKTGRRYYYNTVTHQTTWRHPNKDKMPGRRKSVGRKSVAASGSGNTPKAAENGTATPAATVTATTPATSVAVVTTDPKETTAKDTFVAAVTATTPATPRKLPPALPKSHQPSATAAAGTTSPSTGPATATTSVPPIDGNQTLSKIQAAALASVMATVTADLQANAPKDTTITTTTLAATPAATATAVTTPATAPTPAVTTPPAEQPVAVVATSTPTTTTSPTTTTTPATTTPATATTPAATTSVKATPPPINRAPSTSNAGSPATVTTSTGFDAVPVTRASSATVSVLSPRPPVPPSPSTRNGTLTKAGGVAIATAVATGTAPAVPVIPPYRGTVSAAKTGSPFSPVNTGATTTLAGRPPVTGTAATATTTGLKDVPPSTSVGTTRTPSPGPAVPTPAKTPSSPVITPAVPTVRTPSPAPAKTSVSPPTAATATATTPATTATTETPATATPAATTAATPAPAAAATATTNGDDEGDESGTDSDDDDATPAPKPSADEINNSNTNSNSSTETKMVRKKSDADDSDEDDLDDWEEIVDQIRDGPSELKDGWTVQHIDGRWSKTSSRNTEVGTCGGCYPNFTTWRHNPQYRITLASGTKDNIMVELKVHPHTIARGTDPAIGLYCFKNDGPSQPKICVAKGELLAQSKFVKANPPLTTTPVAPFTPQGAIVSGGGIARLECAIQPFTPLLSSTLALALRDLDQPRQSYAQSGRLPTGATARFPPHYTIIPATFEPGVAADYTISIHSQEKLFIKRVHPSERWRDTTIKGEWKGTSAGGCRNHVTWEQNPQWVLHPAPDGPAGGKMLFVLAQPPSATLHAIGLYALDRHGNIVAKAAFMKAPEVFCELEFHASTGPYRLVPCTHAPGMFGSFTLTTYSQHGSSMEPWVPGTSLVPDEVFVPPSLAAAAAANKSSSLAVPSSTATRATSPSPAVPSTPAATATSTATTAAATRPSAAPVVPPAVPAVPAIPPVKAATTTSAAAKQQPPALPPPKVVSNPNGSWD